MTALCGMSRSYGQFLLARVGVGEAGGTPPANSIIADHFPAARRPMATAMFALSAPIGAYTGADMAGWVAKFLWLARRFPWPRPARPDPRAGRAADHT